MLGVLNIQSGGCRDKRSLISVCVCVREVGECATHRDTCLALSGRESLVTFVLTGVC